ncbi:acyltransferase [Altererythrobacter salegens]|uniref:Acyltransferase n=1 Tax=Croceibacterium salegens TaxID=1737568 RepID=A0A6I4SYQ3_9SPHN|nr:acyltransferase [Croceibacterium salegens]
MKGDVTIYGSALNMFSAEPYMVTLGNNVFISVGVRFVCHDGSTLPFRKHYPSLDIAAPIIVGDNVFIGAGALILKGVAIGNDCIVGANSVVTKDVPSGHIVAGNPAKIIKTTAEWLESARLRSLEIGHLHGEKKHREYKRIFGVGKTT